MLEIYDVLTPVTLDLLKMLNPSASSSRLICSVKWILFETRRSVVHVYGRRFRLRRNGIPNTPPAPYNVFDTVTKLGGDGNVDGIVVGIAYPAEITVMGDNCRSPKMAWATPDFAILKVVAGTQTALATNLCGTLFAERLLSSLRSKGLLTVINDAANVPNC